MEHDEDREEEFTAEELEVVELPEREAMGSIHLGPIHLHINANHLL